MRWGLSSVQRRESSLSCDRVRILASSGGEIRHGRESSTQRRRLEPLRDEFERVAVSGTHNREVPVIVGRYFGEIQPLRDRDDRRVHEPKTEVCILADQFNRTLVVDGSEILDLEPIAGHEGQEPRSASGPNLVSIIHAVSGITGAATARSRPRSTSAEAMW